MALNREIIVAQFELAFGEDAATVLYHSLNEDTKEAMPNTGIFSRRSVHQAIIALLEHATKIKPNKDVADFWQGVYAEFVKIVPATEVQVLPAKERPRFLALTKEERVAADLVKAERAAAQKAASDAAAAKYSAAPTETDPEKDDDIPF